MREFSKQMLERLGIEIKLHRSEFVSLKPERDCQGNFLLSYIVEPFKRKHGKAISSAHTNQWESLQIAKTFLELGYAVDVIHWWDSRFKPKKDYSIFVGARKNFQEIAERLNQDCLKIVHLDTAHWLFNGAAEYSRCLEVQKRKGVALKSFRGVAPNWAIESADCATILGNDFTVGTYAYAQKPIYRLPVPAITTYSWQENKNFEKCRNRFLWFGGIGLVHKGLDLALEAFSQMPDHHLTVCGPIDNEEAFESAYYQELYQTSNIHTAGWIDATGNEFIEITKNCVGMIYPSCSEGQSGAVVTCLQAGLIPIVSYESGIDLDGFGFLLKDCSISEIKDCVRRVSELSELDLKEMSRKAWEYARANHTREKYAEEYRKFAEKILKNCRK
jgi:glycosyltransferase involved in cell wall biosynthesis